MSNFTLFHTQFNELPMKLLSFYLQLVLIFLHFFNFF